MIEPVSTGALISLGWAGRKILGPSLDEIGDQLKLYAGERVRKIFEKVESSAEGASLHHLPGAFSLKFFQAASMSEDDELITNMWANLLIHSSEEFNSRKILYLDILEKLSSDDAILLNSIIDEHAIAHGIGSVTFFLNSVKNTSLWTAERILRERGIEHFDSEAARDFNEAILQHMGSLPVRILGSMVPYQPELPENAPANVRLPSSSATGLANSTAPYDPLIRQRLIQEFSFDFIAGFQIEVEGVMASALGIEFVKNCRGFV